MPGSEPLVLEIIRQDEILKMSIFEEKDIVSTLRHYSQVKVNFSEIQHLCQEVTNILNKASPKGRLANDSLRGLSKTGQLLWDHLLARPAKERLKASHLRDLILSIDEELINIPWELLYDGNNFLCLNFNLGRLVRTKRQAGIGPAQYRSFQDVLKMLILANPTDDLKGAYNEGINIKNQFDRKRNNVHIDFKSTSIDKFYVKKNLCDYDIVHFAGHCEYEESHPKNSGWVLSDGRFSIQDILNMGSTLSLPTLVFSNACYSAGVSAVFIDSDYQRKNYSLAQAFLFSGVRHYLGSVRKLDDAVSLSFAKEFYSHLIQGKSVGECVRLARSKLVREQGISGLYWASYLLYGDPSFALFRTKIRGVSPKTKIDALRFKKLVAWVLLFIMVISIFSYLYIWLPTVNPSTYYLFLKSKQLFQKGSNQEVIALCQGIIKKEPLFLEAYPLLADTYSRLGDRENAFKSYFDYALYSEKKRDNNNLASAYIEIGWFYHLGGEFSKAFDFYQKALNISAENRDRLHEATALRKLAVWYIDKKNYEQALQLLTKSSEINRERQYLYAYRYNLACDYFDLGLVFSNKDDFAGAKEFYRKSRRLFEKLKLKHQLSDYYFNLGEISLFEKEYQKALDYYAAGLKIDEAQDNKMNLASDYNMIGELYAQMDNNLEAERFFNQALAISKQINASPELASANHNLGLLYKKLGKKNKAREYLRQAQEIYRLQDSDSYQEIKKELLELDSR